MMRRPTPASQLLAWWSNALKGVFREEATVFNEEPEVGFFKRRLVKEGPFVPARIWMYQPVDETGELTGDEQLFAEIDGQWADPHEAWSWLCGNPITEAEFSYLTAARQWAEQNAPDEPMANPREKIDWMKVPFSGISTCR